MPAVIDARRLPLDKQARLKVLTAQAREHLAPHVQAEALRFVTRFATQLDVEPALMRFLRDCNMPSRLAAETYDRVLVLCADVPPPAPEASDFDLVTLVRPDRWWKKLRDAMDETQLLEFWIRLAIAEAHERLMPIHAAWAHEFARVCMPELPLEDALSAYARDLELNEPLATSVYQRTLALFAAELLPKGDDARITQLLEHLHPVGVGQAPKFGLSPVDLIHGRPPQPRQGPEAPSAPAPFDLFEGPTESPKALTAGSPEAAPAPPPPREAPRPKRRTWFPLSAPEADDA